MGNSNQRFVRFPGQQQMHHIFLQRSPQFPLPRAMLSFFPGQTSSTIHSFCCQFCHQCYMRSSRTGLQLPVSVPDSSVSPPVISPTDYPPNISYLLTQCNGRIKPIQSMTAPPQCMVFGWALSIEHSYPQPCETSSPVAERTQVGDVIYLNGSNAHPGHNKEVFYQKLHLFHSS